MKRLLTLCLFWIVWIPVALAVPVFEAEVVERHPHDRAAFTQGLLWHDGKLYESTGLHGQSSLREVDLDSGEVLRRVGLPRHEFGEDITILGGRLFQLTWRNGRAHVYAPDGLERIKSFRYRGEGWGLTHDGESLIMSDGSDLLTFRDPETFAVLRRVDVTLGGRPLRLLNAMQYVDGKVYANVWTTTYIAVIDPGSGITEALIDLAPLLEHLDFVPDLTNESPNGIAYDPDGRRLFVTGKLWPWLFEIRMPE